VANSPFVSVQLPYIISGGFGGLLLCGGGIALLVMSDLRDEWRKLDRIEAAILGHWVQVPSDAPNHTAAEPAPGPAPADHAPTGALRRRAGLGVGMLLGVAILVAGWERAAATTRPAVAYQGVAVGSLALVLCLAAVTVVVVGQRAGLVRRRVVLLGGWLASDQALQSFEPETEDAATHVFIASTSRRFHRPTCPTLVGLDSAAVRRDAVPAGLEPCGICGAS
jgi:hypothetical protein